MIFNETIHSELAQLFDLPGYAGYRPTMAEAPAGGTKECPGPWVNHAACQFCLGAGRVPDVDVGKRFLHVALKYNPPAWAERHLARAHWEACKVADAIGVPDAYGPRPEDGTLRVLEYPAGAGTVKHTDWNLFTVLCWRSHPGDLLREPEPGVTSVYATRHETAERINPGLHIGEIGEMVGLGPATPHEVPPRPYVQKSIVYFAMPRLDVHLPWCGPGPTVRAWLDEKKRTTRVYT